MKQNFYFLLTCAAVAFSLACGSATPAETTKTNAPANTAPANQTKTETKTDIKTETKTATLRQSTPTEAGESFFNAMKAKDAAAFKQLMSKDSLEILEAAASEKKMTLDDLLTKQFFPNTPMPAAFEQRGEKITGDKATTEMKDEKGEWSPMIFVKEGGVWKVSLE